MPIASHDPKAGVLNFARTYTNLEDYKASESEGSGVVTN